MKGRGVSAGRGRLLDAWQGPGEWAGSALGCLATTFTFQATFFEEHCLARFIGLSTDPQERDETYGAAAYLIEREERLAEVFAGVLIDRRHAQAAERSLRWDALPTVVTGAAMHAKVSLLAWSECVRLIISSANLTEVAYRKNLEVYGILDFHDGGESSLAELRKTINFLGEVLALAPAGTARSRADSFLDRVRRQTSDWRERHDRRPTLKVAVVFGGRLAGNDYSALQSLREEVWSDSSPPRRASVLSPFFDRERDGAPNKTALALRAALARRGHCEISFDVACDLEGDGARRVYAPQSLRRTLPDAVFNSVQLEEDGEVRPLHAKGLWLENERRAVYLIGSSNFTSAGMGVGQGAWNVEANVAYVAHDADAYNALCTAYPVVEEIKDIDGVFWEPVFDLDAEPNEVTPALPSAFADASFSPEDNGGVLNLTLDGEPPAEWRVERAGEAGALYDSSAWHTEGKPLRMTIRLVGGRPPSSLAVYWPHKDGSERRALWLVNVSDPNALPPPEALRGLTLETLLDVLTMTRPLYEAVIRALKQPTVGGRSKDTPPRELDPHARVRTETFLLQRTRRIARALEHLRVRLERPAHTREALRWRLRGPVGPLALARAVEREGRSAGEVVFLLAEIALTLSRVVPAKAPGALRPYVVHGEMKDLIKEIGNVAASRLSDAPPDLGDYVARALKEASK